MLPQYVDFIKWVNRFLHDGSSAYIERSGDPSTPISGELDLYAKDKSGTSALYYKNDAGTVLDLSGGLTGSGTSGRVAFWDGTLSLSSDTDLTFSADTLTATKLSSTGLTLTTGGGGAVGNVRSHPTLNSIEVGPTSASSILSLISVATQRFVIGASGQFGIGASPDYGTSGYVLSSGGASAAPTWASGPASAATGLTVGSVVFVGTGPVL